MLTTSFVGKFDMNIKNVNAVAQSQYNVKWACPNRRKKKKLKSTLISIGLWKTSYYPKVALVIITSLVIPLTKKELMTMITGVNFKQMNFFMGHQDMTGVLCSV